MWAFIAMLFLILPLEAQILGDLKVAFIRISFPLEEYPGVTSDGTYEMLTREICGEYTIDAAPHDQNYFNSHVEAVDNYFRAVSKGKFGLDLNKTKVFPNGNSDSYLIKKPMNYYNELGQEDLHENRITHLLKDGIQAAYDKDQLDFTNFDLVAIIHPGVGQDFKLPFLDPTPEDIPSTFIDEKMVIKHLGGPIQIGLSSIQSGVILPATQNHIIMDETIYEALTNPCELQYSITGTWALMIGFAVGLPPLWNLETGSSGVGVFALMDQGSNNANGIIPAPPNAWTRIYAGWETAEKIEYPGRITLNSDKGSSVIKIPISNDEYYLVENRNNWFRNGVSIDSARYSTWEKTDKYPSVIEVLFDSVGVMKNAYGVISSLPKYDLGLPGSGLLIWHIDEKKINEGIETFKINEDRNQRGIDLEEADGAQDIGHISNLLTDPSSGYWGDMWFAENNEYYRANLSESMDFTSYTYPNTKSNSGANSGINILDISRADESMTFNLFYSYDSIYLKDKRKSILFKWDVDDDGDLDFIGEGDSLWWGDGLNSVQAFSNISGKYFQACVVQNTSTTALATIQAMEKYWSIEWFSFDKNSNTFLKIWEKRKTITKDLKLLKGDGKNLEIWTSTGDSTLIFSENNIQSLDSRQGNMPYVAVNNMRQYQLNDFGITSSSISKFENNQFEGNFDFVTLIDLENDGETDLLLTDVFGTIHSLDSKFIYKNGFPLNANATSPVLGIDLLNDENPELIFQSLDGSIRIHNSEGMEIDRIINGERLIGVDNINGYNGILTETKIYKFKKSSNRNGNEWNYLYGRPDFSRRFEYVKKGVPNTQLMNKKLTYAYPNPSFGDNVIFRIQSGQADNIKINIYDLAGFSVESINKDFKGSNFSTTNGFINDVREVFWDISKIEPGIYLARITVSSDSKSEEKVIKVGIVR